MTEIAPVLDIRDLRLTYRSGDRLVHAVNGVSLQIAPGEILGIAGESGCGKSSLALATLGNGSAFAGYAGEVRFRGENILGQDEAKLRRLWNTSIAMVFQDPASSLSPVLSIGSQVRDVIHGSSASDATRRIQFLFQAVGLPATRLFLRRYPHELSGGQQQRICIALALACNPRLVVMDEPTTGLDVTTEAQVLALVRQLRRNMGVAFLYISHNLAVLRAVCDRIAVMYAGRIVEAGPVDRVIDSPRHPYTVALIRCLPRVDAPPSSPFLPTILGSLPFGPTRGCQFHARCGAVKPICATEAPPARWDVRDHMSLCHFSREDMSSPLFHPEADELKTPAETSLNATPALVVSGLTHRYGTRRPRLFGGPASRPVLSAVSIAVAPGETLAIVGESGSGKSTLAKCVVGLERPEAGHITIGTVEVGSIKGNWPRHIRKSTQLVFQKPDSTLNPVLTVFTTLARPLKQFGRAPANGMRASVLQLLRVVGLSERHADVLPHQLSGGERQRVAIARAFATNPSLVLCDEPTSALDVSVQAHILNLLRQLQADKGVSYVLISHDLSVVRHLADKVAVLFRGKIVESGSTEEVFSPPFHPYTEALINSVPTLGLPKATTQPREIQADALGEIGCPFHCRCARKVEGLCDVEEPPRQSSTSGHQITCHILLEDLARFQQEAP